ncbi:Predicted acyl esterase [Pseudomonas syringae pv. actinidiae]|uniref:Predicted acyl esterase n=1 Tax=Pseudomonas syringae pv. actinidiae TaxID=103796 RepID=A0AAN4QCI9_PSESF|nr:Predicted acyl esterase [Pseudomonas syringae pv. actinidiae]
MAGQRQGQVGSSLARRDSIRGSFQPSKNGGVGSNGTENQRKAWLEFANPLRLRGLANFDFLNEFMAPLFRVISPTVALAEAVS